MMSELCMLLKLSASTSFIFVGAGEGPVPRTKKRRLDVRERFWKPEPSRDAWERRRL